MYQVIFYILKIKAFRVFEFQFIKIYHAVSVFFEYKTYLKIILADDAKSLKEFATLKQIFLKNAVPLGRKRGSGPPHAMGASSRQARLVRRGQASLGD